MIKAPDFIRDYSVGGFRRLEIVVVGAGGTGSALIGKLFQMQSTLKNLGIRGFDVTVIDDDIVSPSNIGRQAFWACDIGHSKAKILVDRLNNFGSAEWSFKVEKFDAVKFVEAKKYSSTVIFGCVDNVDARKDMHHAMQHTDNVVWIDGGNDSRSANVLLGMNAKVHGKTCYLPSVYDLFQSQMDNLNVVPEPSCSTEEAIAKQGFGINDATASQMVQILWQLIRHGQVAYQGVAIDLPTGTTTPIEADPAIWAMFGYTEKEKAA